MILNITGFSILKRDDIHLKNINSKVQTYTEAKNNSFTIMRMISYTTCFIHVRLSQRKHVISFLLENKTISFLYKFPCTQLLTYGCQILSVYKLQHIKTSFTNTISLSASYFYTLQLLYKCNESNVTTNDDILFHAYNTRNGQ